MNDGEYINRPESINPGKLNNLAKEKIFLGLCTYLSIKYELSVILLRTIFSLLILWGGMGILVYLIFSILLRHKLNELKLTTNGNFFWGIVLVFSGFLFILKNTFIFSVLNIFEFSNTFIISSVFILLGVILIINKDDLFSYSQENYQLIKLGEDDKKIFGVCSGLANYLDVNANALRMIWMLFSFATAGIGAIIYLVLFFLLRDSNLD